MSANRNLSKAVVTKHVLNAVAAGTTNQTSSAIDTLGANGVRVIADIGALTAGQVTKMKLQSSTDDGVTDAYADIAGSETAAMADGDSNKLLIIDLYKPRERYIKAIVERSTQNAVINCVIAEIFMEDFQPVTQDATVSQLVTIFEA